MKKFGVQFRLPNGEISCAGAVPFEAESAEEAIRKRVESGGHFEAGLPFDEMMRSAASITSPEAPNLSLWPASKSCINSSSQKKIAAKIRITIPDHP